MIDFIYKHNDYPYRVVRFREGEAFQIFAPKDILIGSISKVGDTWKQYSGRVMSDEIIEGVGKYIDDNKLWS